MPKFRTWVVGLFIVAFLCTRLMGLHVHLCFDGTEPPLSLQSQTNDLADVLADAQRANLQQTGPMALADVDIDLVGNALAKLAKIALDLPILLVAFALLLLARRPVVPQQEFADLLLVPFDWPHIRPPLRAPPL